jgi:hypothetical protein
MRNYLVTMKFFKSIGYFLGLTWDASQRFPNDKRIKRLRQLLAYLRADKKINGSRIVLVECVQDPFYLCLFAHLTYALRKRASIKIELFVPQSIDAAVGFSFFPFIKRTFPLGRLKANQWIRLWDVVSNKIAYRSTSLRYPIGDIVDGLRSLMLWRQFNSPEQIKVLSISGVLCGDLIIDSYLRFRPSPRILVKDIFMLQILWQAHRDVRRAKNYFHKYKPSLYITTYTGYIEHGIAARVALQEGVALVSFGNFQEFGKFHATDDFYHTRNCLNYRHDFNLIPSPAPLLSMASKVLDFRLAGGIDIATSYMVNSAYKITTYSVPNVQGAVIVFLHDFYDSPHIYDDLVFPDFWEWICFTCEILKSAGIRFLIKPHPNQISLSKNVIDQLVIRFPDIELIAQGITNRQLVDSGMVCAVTVYGTVALEMAYMGIPTIACARHPHIAFDFCRTAKNRAMYAEMLCDSLSPAMNPKFLREQALQFFVMDYINYPVEQIQLRDALIKAWNEFDSPLNSAAELASYFEKIVELPYFTILIDRMLKFSDK